MTAVMIWKEYRQHRHVWFALALLAIAVLLGVPLAMGSPLGELTRINLTVVAFVLAWMQGLVCGAAMLAGEQEEGTQQMLDRLPAWRAIVWRAKALSGLLFVLLFCSVISSLAVFQGLVLVAAPLTVLLVFVCGLFGLSLGLGASAFARSALEAVGLAILALFGGSGLLFFFAMFLTAVGTVLLGGRMPFEPSLVVMALVAMVAPVTISGLHYTRDDKGRVGPSPRPQLPGPSAWRQINWLCWRQFSGLLLVCPVVGLLVGFAVAQAGVYVFPPVSLILGVSCGICLFRPEQDGSHRFWAEQRMPLGTLWWTKFGYCFLALSLGWVCQLLPALFSSSARTWPDETLNRLGSQLLLRTVPIGTYLLLWPLTGFAVGAVLGMLNRKALPAFVVSLIVSVALCAIWVPSLLVGGLEPWLPLLPALALLALSRSLVRPWATEQLGTSSVVLRVAATALFVGLVVAGGLAWRVYGVADVPEPEELQAMVDRLPALEDNEAGRLVKRALEQAGQHLPAGVGEADEQASAVVEKGWGAAGKELRAALDQAFAGEWTKTLAEAARKPLGVVDDPRRLNNTSQLPHLEAAWRAGKFLAAQGLRLQAEKGDHAAFVAYLDMGLALARNLEHAGCTGSSRTARSVEQTMLEAHHRWLEQLPHEPKLLARAEAVLRRHEEQLPPDEERLANYLIDRNSLDAPERWLAQNARVGPDEAQMLALALSAPWERARQERGLRALRFAQSVPDSAYPFVAMFPGTIGLSNGKPRPLARQFALTAARTVTALRRYLAENQKPAERLKQLVPAYLPAVPLDPYDDQPLRYRLSKGEKIKWPDVEVVVGGAAPAGAAAPGVPGPAPPPVKPPETTRTVAPGQGIIWSVGDDLHDDGGKHNARKGQPSQRGEDLIVLVPQPRR
jgi:hypothetical protein